MVIQAPAIKADPKAAGPLILTLLSYLSWAFPKLQVRKPPHPDPRENSPPKTNGFQH